MSKRFIAEVASSRLMAGCAPIDYQKADIDGRITCNAEPMDQVERRARARGVDVRWVNCPRVPLRVI